MTIRARIEVDYLRGALRCVLVDREPDSLRVVQASENYPDQLVWRSLPAGAGETQATVPDPPLGFLIPEDAALALLDELLNHFRGGHDARQLRADYEHERARVDKFIDVVTRGMAANIGGDAARWTP